ncbi:glyoxalase [Reticulibacter mediterranei]|uniref:Glyoxalase n=1 Tax=Reticulibacter mediterranei TaxID=2778369 RepID=A0A8J3IK87_9CHLR|nr:VOC family protein [Reticulibacter mediterranei]GHO93973.1 glyoxalase [Reticulibacter mediterranei]
MGLELYMLGLIPQNINASLEFYRRLGIDLPERIEGPPHVGAKMESGITFFLNNMVELVPEADRPRVMLEFYLKERALVDAKYAELTGYGYQGYRAPFDVPPIKMYFAMINDPDGNIVLLSADQES